MRKKKPKLPAGLDADHASLYRAFLTVGQETEAQLRWLSEFADRDVSNPVVAELSRWEVDAFVQSWSVAWHIEPFASLLGSKVDDLVIAEGVARTPIVPSRSPSFEHPDFGAEAVPGLQQEAQRLFRSLREQREEPRAPGYSFGGDIFGELRICGVPARALIFTRPDPRARFVGAIACLFIATGPLAFCEDAACRRPFVTRRPWQKFCSARCNNRSAQAEHRSRRTGEERKT